MRIILILLITTVPFFSASRDIKTSRSNVYNKSLQASSIKLNPKPIPSPKKIRDINPIFVPKRPTLNGNFSQQLAYKNSQSKIITRPKNQLPPS